MHPLTLCWSNTQSKVPCLLQVPDDPVLRETKDPEDNEKDSPFIGGLARKHKGQKGAEQTADAVAGNV